jgi:hypothetical protein
METNTDWAANPVAKRRVSGDSKGHLAPNAHSVASQRRGFESLSPPNKHFKQFQSIAVVVGFVLTTLLKQLGDQSVDLKLIFTGVAPTVLESA